MSLMHTPQAGPRPSSPAGSGPSRDANSTDPNETNTPNVFPNIDEVTRAERQLDHIFRLLDRMEANFEKRSSDVVSLNLIVVRIKDLSSQAAEVFSVLFDVPDPETYKRAEESYTNFDDRVFELNVQLQQRLLALTPNVPIAKQDPEPEKPSVKSNHIKLPELKLPSFDGTVRDWPPYRDAFCSMIGSSECLSDCEKLSYLMSTVTKDAKHTIENIPITAANYAVAWKLLTDRYENKYILVKSYCDALFDIPVCKKESAETLNEKVNEFERNLRLLQSEGENTENWSTLLVFRLTSLLDHTTLRQWELTRSSKTIPTYSELIGFLRNHCRTLQSVSKQTGSLKPSDTNRSKDNAKDFGKKVHTVHAAIADTNKCVFCSEPKHSPFQCQVFRRNSVTKRKELVKSKALCFNCFSPNHRVNNCNSSSCRVCQQKHHTMLHEEIAAQPSSSSSVAVPRNSAPHAFVSHSDRTQRNPEPSTSLSHVSMITQPTQIMQKQAHILLQTAIVTVSNAAGRPSNVRILLNSGAQLNIVTERLINRLRLQKYREVHRIGGIGKTNLVSNNYANLNIQSKYNDFKTTVKCHILPEITRVLPTSPIDISSWDLPSNIELADPTFHQPGQIDMLIGIDLFYDVVQEGLIKLPNSKTVLQNTCLGWVVAGLPPIDHTFQAETSHAFHACSMEEQVARIGELEPCQSKKDMSLEETASEEQISWDESLSANLEQRWLPIRSNLAQLHDLTVPRWMLSTSNPACVELHGFCDTSEKAYGACVYVRTIGQSGHISCHLLVSKSRVAPIGNSKKERRLSLPRLELCAAHLLAQLYQKVSTALQANLTPYFWSDSTIVLHWLSSPSSRWKTFLANRVSDIQHLTSDNWHHVPGVQNPADYISRGANPNQLAYCQMWWHGPEWLIKTPEFWPTQHSLPDQPNSEVLEERTVLLNQTVNPNTIFLMCSSYPKLQKRIAWIRRYLYNIKPENKEKRLSAYLSLQELDEATNCLVRLAQQEVFGAEISSLQKNGQIDSNSRLKSLTPYLDDNLLRVGGRLRHADVSQSQKHPLILPAGHPSPLLIANHYHHCFQHAGSTLLISLIREKFWPLRARNLARRIIHSCIRCFRCRPSPLEQLMGDLPKERVTPTLPFLRTGVDLCGPIFYKYPHRKAASVKGYVAIFVCLVVKAVHIEIVADLSTNAFLAALRRFVSRRGRPELIECDNATNFVGASREIAQLAKQFQQQQWQETITNRVPTMESCSNSYHRALPTSVDYGKPR